MRVFSSILLLPALLMLPTGCTSPPNSGGADATTTYDGTHDGIAADAVVADGPTFDASPADGPTSDAVPDAPLCGLTGQACCTSGAPCLAPNAACSPSNICELEFVCGDQGQDCCDGACNSPDLVCTRSGGLRLRCEPCGGAGEPCCEGGACGDDGCCVSDRCVEDGASCESGGVNLGSCSAGQCQGCGGLGEPCCPDLLNRCYEGVCPVGIDPVCSACGETGQPCCEDNVCTTGCCGKDRSCIAPNTPCGSGTCIDGSCGGCGGLNEPCCDPYATLWCAQSNTACDGQFCVAAP